jgi:hypothetical protein
MRKTAFISISRIFKNSEYLDEEVIASANKYKIPMVFTGYGILNIDKEEGTSINSTF